MAANACSVCSKNVARLLSYGKSLSRVSRVISSSSSSSAAPTTAVVSQRRTYSKFEEEDLRASNYDHDQGWPDELLGPVTPTNHKFPLPGNTSAKLPLDDEDGEFEVNHPANAKTAVKSNSSAVEMLEESSNSQKHLGALSHFIAESDMGDGEYSMDEVLEVANLKADDNVSVKIINNYFKHATVEITAQSCPDILRKDFGEVFVDMPKQEGDKLTVVTIVQKTNNDMSGWNCAVDEERERNVKNFVEAATEICHLLRANNFWADFLDPSSGQAYFGSHSNSSLMETDERFNQLRCGFTIDDLGCCRVISHHKWAHHAQVLSLVTNVPRDHHLISLLPGSHAPTSA